MSELDELRAEVERLRELVGPSEQSYLDLRHDVSAAADAAKEAELAAGALRGQLAVVATDLARAQQSQEWWHRWVYLKLRAVGDRLAGLRRRPRR